MAGKGKGADDADAAADPKGDAAAEGGKPARKFSLKLILIVVGGVVLLGGGGVAGFMAFSSKSAEKPAAAVVKPAVFIDVPEVLVNLSTAGSDRTQYLKVKVVLELPDEKLKEKIQPVMPRVMDTFQTFLRELRPSDLEGSAGLYRLKEELTRRVNAAISPNKINAVLFKEVVVQ